jgi:uncharacterized pyridoxamine 5'-phosphate oxidase family protein
VHETAQDLDRLQALLDRSYAGAGEHLRSISTPDRLVSAVALAEHLTGVRLLALATVTADGRPLVGPVDGLFYRGEFWFGSGENSVRFRHLRARPAVSATHIDGEQFAVTVHGTAYEVDLASPEASGFAQYCVEVYGAAWLDWDGEAPYARIEAKKMFTFSMPADAAEDAGV